MTETNLHEYSMEELIDYREELQDLANEQEEGENKEGLLEQVEEISNQIKLFEDRIEQKKKEEEKEKVNLRYKSSKNFKRWVYAKFDDRYHNLYTGEILRIGPFNAEMNIHIPEFEDEETKKMKKVAKTAHAYFCNDIRQMAYSEEYSPGDGLLFKDKTGKTKLNSYTENSIPKVIDHTSEEGKIIIDRIEKHFITFFPNEYEQIFQWFAHNVQKPGQKINWALAFVGIQGTGKSMPFYLLEASVGHANIKNISSNVVNSKFSDWTTGHCVAVIDELALEKNSKLRVMDTLKDAITNKLLSVNRKGLSIIDGVRNTQNYIITSNHDDALSLESSDRRWCVLRDNIRNVKEDVFDRFNNPDYYKEIYQSITDNPGIIRSWLLSIDISDFNINVPPQTQAKRDMYVEDQDYEYHQINTMLEELDIDIDILSTYLIRAKYNQEMSYPINPQKLSKVLKALGYRNIEKVIKVQGKRHFMYSLEDMNIENITYEEFKNIIRQLSKALELE